MSEKEELEAAAVMCPVREMLVVAREIVEFIDVIEVLDRERFREEWGREHWEADSPRAFRRLKELVAEMSEKVEKLP